MKSLLSTAHIDREKLLAWLTDRANHKTLLVAAVYAGLADRIRRGDFDGGDNQ